MSNAAEGESVTAQGAKVAHRKDSHDTSDGRDEKLVGVPSTLDSLLFLSHSQDKERFPIPFAIDDFQFVEAIAKSKNSTVWLVNYRFANNLLVLKVRL